MARLLCLLIAVGATALAQFNELPLTSGVASGFTVGTVNNTLLCCFRIEVPPGATRVEIRVGGLSVATQFAIVVRVGAQPVSSPLTADYPVVVGTNPLVITPASNPPLRAGTFYIGTAVVTSPASQTGTMTVTVTAPAPDPVGSLTSVSAASLTPTVAPDSIVSSFGQGLAAGVNVAASADLPETLGDSTVTVTDSAGAERMARLFFVAPNQVNFLLGPETALGMATVRVRRAGRVAAAGSVRVERVVPAIFTANSSGTGVAAAQALRVRPDGSQTLDVIFRCAAPGSCTPIPIEINAEDQVFLLLYGTGMRGRSSAGAVSATLAGEPAETTDAVPQGQYQGLDQVNVRISTRLSGRGVANLILTIDGRAANTVTIQIGGTAPPPPPQPGKLPAVPSGRVYQPVAAGMEWTYRVTFPQTVRIPHKPIVEAPDGLLCASVFCGLQTWNAGQIEFRVIASEMVSTSQGSELWNATVTDRGAAFFFPTVGPIQIRRRLVEEGSASIMQLELVHSPSATLRLVRPLSRPNQGGLIAGILDAATLTVAAGAFNNVVTAETTVVGDTGSGFTGTYRTEFKLAPNVGIIRAIMRDPSGQILFTQELVRFSEPAPLPLPRFRISNVSFGPAVNVDRTPTLPIEFDFEDPSGTASAGPLTLAFNLDGTSAGVTTVQPEALAGGRTGGRIRAVARFSAPSWISGRSGSFTFTLTNSNRDESNPLGGSFTPP